MSFTAIVQFIDKGEMSSVKRVRVYNIFWELNYQLKFLVELVFLYGIRANVTRGHEFKSQLRII